MRQKKIHGGLQGGAFLTLLALGIAACSSHAVSVPLTSAEAPTSHKSCARGRSPKDGFPFLGLQAITNSRQVTIFGDDKARNQLDKSSVEMAVRKWLTTCKQEDYSFLPILAIDWDHDRPSFEDKIYRTTLLINFAPDEEAPYDPQEGKATVAEWLRTDNSIKVFGKCGYRKMGMPCDKTRDLINWKSDWGSMVIAHEIGHALGLDHDYQKCKMHGLMQTIADKNIILPVIHDYCRLANDINNESAPCNSVETEADKHPCDDDLGDYNETARNGLH